MAKMSSFEKFLVNSRWDYFAHKFFWASRLLKDIENSGIQSILEIGCGSGITTSFIAKKFPQAQIIAIDYDETQIERAKKNSVSKDVNFLQGDATNLSFPDNSFDACFAILTFHHIPQFPDALREIYRVLKKGGSLYIMDIPIKALNPLNRLVSIHAHAPSGKFTKEELIQHLKQTGFKIKKSKGNLLLSLGCEKL